MCKARRTRCPLDAHRQLWRATDSFKSLSVSLHLLIAGQPRHDVVQDLSGVGIVRFYNSIMDPLAFAAGAYNSCAPEIREVSADLRLIRFQDFDKKAHANFFCAHEMKQA